MGYPLDTAAQNAALDAMLGDNAAASMPASFELALFDAHPLSGGAELTSTGGYARVTVANSSAIFPAASDGRKTSVAITFANPSAPWSDTASHWVLFDAADSTTRYFVGLLSEEIDVQTGTETDIAAVLALTWNTEGL